MLCGEIVALCSENHTKHKGALCGQNVEILIVKLMVREVTIGTEWVKGRDKNIHCRCRQLYGLIKKVIIPVVSVSIVNFLQATNP